MKPLSNDLRTRIVAMYKAGGKSYAEVAEHYGVSVVSVIRFVKMDREGRSLEPKPHTGGPTAIYDEAFREGLRKHVEGHPDATLEEIREGLGSPISIPWLHRTLQAMGVRRKKKPVRRGEAEARRG